MNWLVLSFYLTLGMNLHQSYAIQSASDYAYWQAPDNSVVSTLGSELLAIDHVFLDAEVKTEESYLHGVNFSPFYSEYTVKAGLRFGGFEAGFIDNCIHPTLDTNAGRSSYFYGGYQGFYASFKGKVKLF